MRSLLRDICVKRCAPRYDLLARLAGLHRIRDRRLHGVSGDEHI